MPDDLIAYTAQQFLTDDEVFVWARCSSILLRAMRSYRISRTVPLLQLLCRSEGRELLPALEPELADFANPEYWPDWSPTFGERLFTLLTAALDDNLLMRKLLPAFQTDLAEIADPEFWPDWFPAFRERLFTILMARLAPPISIKSDTNVSLPSGTEMTCRVVSRPLESLYSAEIGRVTCVEINTAPFWTDLIVTRFALLPACVTSVKLKWYQGSHPLRLSPSCTELTIGCLIQTPALQDMELPESGLLHLVFDCAAFFNESLDHLRLPFTLHTLHFGEKFNQSIENLQLPASLTDLKLGSRDFNQPVERLKLPNGLRSLEFARHFNQSIERLELPPTLTYLHMGQLFNQPLVQWRPPASLTAFVLSDYWGLPSDQLRLPPALVKFSLPFEFHHPISDAFMQFPCTLQSLECMTNFNQPLVDITWPASLTSLRLEGAFCQRLEVDDWTPPPCLTFLSINNYSWPIDRLCLPPSLTHLYLRLLNLRHPLPENFEWPPLLLILELRLNECESPGCVPRSLPRTLQQLKLSKTFTCPSQAVDAWLALPRPINCQCEVEE